MRQTYMEIFFTFTLGLQSGPSEVIAKIEGRGGGGGGGQELGNVSFAGFLYRLEAQFTVVCIRFTFSLMCVTLLYYVSSWYDLHG